MFDKMTVNYIEAAINNETYHAVEKYGLTYNSLHEGYAVLKEEIDEARDEQIEIKNRLYRLWNEVKANQVNEDNAKSLRNHAEQLALEACQIAAVCEKILKSI